MTQPHPAEPLRLLLVDDHSVMRSGLANMLNSRLEFEVVGGADDGETALELHRQLVPDITLLDVVMPGMGGLECLKRIRQQCADARVLMLSSSDVNQDLHDALKLGACGFVAKSAEPSQLIKSVLAVSRGDMALSDEVTQRLESHIDAPPLTPRENEVLQLLRKGMSNPDIGMILDISPRTAKAHVAAILVKLNAQDRAEAVARGFERGLLRP